MKSEPLMVMVPARGPDEPVVAFVSASPNKIDAIRGQALCGPAGETFRDAYLSRLEIDREDALLLHLVPLLMVNDKGRAREPDNDEIAKYRAAAFHVFFELSQSLAIDWQYSLTSMFLFFR